MLAQVLTGSRIVAALAMAFFPMDSIFFWVLYVWCGVSDVLDGPIARRTGSESELGANLDSTGDFLFAVVALSKLFFTAPFDTWLVVWIGIVIICKIVAGASAYLVHGRVLSLHTYANKASGIAIFITIPILYLTGNCLVAIPACVIATFAALLEGHLFRMGKTAKDLR